MNVNPEQSLAGQAIPGGASEATRSALVSAARPLFAERGFAGVGAEEIVRAAGVTRGALYHHFDGKAGLFEAVYEEVEVELAERIATGALGRLGGPAGGDARRRGDVPAACTEPEVQRIALIDGPSVLGWDRWREIGAAHGLGLIEASLQAAIDAGVIAPQPVRPLAHILMGALDEAAMLVARAEDPEAMQGRGLGHHRLAAGRARRRRLTTQVTRSPPRAGSMRGSKVSLARRRDSFCAYIRMSASRSAAEASAASPGPSRRPRRS